MKGVVEQVAVLGGFGDRWRRWAAWRAKPRRAAELVVGERMRAVGAAQPMGDPKRSPFTKTPCVFWSVEVFHKVRPGADGELVGDSEPRWDSIMTAFDHTPFVLVDGDGARVIVDPSWSLLELDPLDVTEHPYVNDENPEFVRFMRKNGMTTTKYMGIAGEHMFKELAVPIGAEISAWGPVDEVVSVATQGYRDAQTKAKRISGKSGSRVVLLYAR